MATVNKDFKIKYGLVVEGASATVNGNQVLTETASDTYILNLIGGETLVKSVSNEFDVSVAGELSIDRATVDAYYDAAGSAADALADANSYTNGEITTALSTAQGYANTAEFNANSYTDGRETAITTAYQGYADQAELDAIASSNSYTDAAVAGAIGDIPTSTDELTEGLTNLYYTDSRARGAVSDGDGLNYNSATGVFSAHLGNGLEIGVGGEIQIDDSIVATETDLTNAISAHDVTSGVHGVTGDIVGTTDSQTISNKTLGSDLAAGGFQITNLGTPVNSTDAATKAYVDAVSEGLHVHEAARVAIQGNISIATGLENGDTAGGVTLATGDRVLVKDQTNAAENGIYVVQPSGQALRATDFDTATEIDSGDFIFVTAGTYANTGWVQTLKPATIGTDALSFTQFSGAGTFTAGNGLLLDGTEFAIDESITATKTYVDGEIDAHTALTSAHGVTGNVVGTSDSQTLTNKTLGSGTVLSANIDAANTYTIANLEEPVNNQDAATKFYVDGEISSLSAVVDNLTTTDIAEGTNLYFTDGRARLAISDGDGISYDNLTGVISADLGTGLSVSTGQIAVDRTTVDTWYDASGTASGLINALTSDDIEEGSTNLYFESGRAKTAAAELLTGASLTNITITGTGAGLTITAENGVADSTTDDLEEGVSNLYFTDQRAIDAIQDTTPNFTAVEVNSIAKEVATTATIATAGTATALTWDVATHRTVKAIVKFATADHTEVSEVLLTLDGLNNVAITEYAEVGTNGAMGTVTATVVSGEGRINVTTLNNATVVIVRATLLA